MDAWYVYLVRAAGGVLYAGITVDVDRRLRQHELGSGAKYLRGRAPLVVVYRRKVGDRSLALRVERRLKSLSKPEKEALARASPSRKSLLASLDLSERRGAGSRAGHRAGSGTRGSAGPSHVP